MRFIVTNNVADYLPVPLSACYSPNGKRIAYAVFDEHKFDIYMVNVGGGDRVRVTNDKGVTSPAREGAKVALDSDPLPRIRYALGNSLTKAANLLYVTALATKGGAATDIPKKPYSWPSWKGNVRK
jgi:hypothetical protein